MTDSAITDEQRVSETSTKQLWPDGMILLVHIILPIAITGAIIGRKAIFSRLWSHVDKSFVGVFCPSFSKREKLKKWMTDYLPNVDGGLGAIWKDGSLMCTLINSVVPGACPNPHRHWRKPPIHGQALAYKYLGVTPVFSEIDFLNSKLSFVQEKLLLDYVSNLQAAFEKISPQSEITFSTRYIARGMGLVTGEQHRKTVIYIYPNFKGQTMDDLLVNIRGPFNTYGSTSLKALSFTEEKSTKQPDKRQSFLKSLSSDFSNLLKPKDRGPACDIEIKTEFEPERAKLIFVPNNSGVYEVCFITNGEHIVGSPYNLSIEKNRRGITQNLNDIDVKPSLSPKRSGRKKVTNTVICYEKLKKLTYEERHGPRKISKVNCEENGKSKILSTDENLNITLKNVEDQKYVSENIKILTTKQEEYNSQILETLEQLNNLLQSTESINVDEVEKKENYGLNIIDTLRNIPELKKNSPEINQNSINYEPNKEIDEISTDNQTITKGKGFKSHDKLLNDSGVCFKLHSKPEISSFEDSGTYVNDDIDPDSLSSSLELQGSSEEISYSATSGSDSNENEVNNNNILVKSNEDICYLILNQNTSNHHKRIYSKDFVSCKDEQSKDDVSKSDPNLQVSSAASALFLDNVQEAKPTAMSSRIFNKHPQEERCIATTRNYSYSHGSLNATSSKDGNEFKQHFLMKKAFWMNISMTNISMTTLDKDRSDSGSRKKSSRAKNVIIGSKLNETDSGVLLANANQVRNLARCESAKNLEFRSRTSDHVPQHKKTDDPVKDTGRFGSVDDLNFPSVRHRREMYLTEQRNQTPSKSLDIQEPYADKSEKYMWSIHEKIKTFETGPLSFSPQLDKSKKLQILPGNITAKIKERFEKAQTYFKDLEGRSRSSSGAGDKQPYSLDGDSEGFNSLNSLQSMPNMPTNTNILRQADDIKTKVYDNNTISSFTLNGLNERSDGSRDTDELQLLFNARRKRRHQRLTAIDVFN